MALTGASYNSLQGNQLNRESPMGRVTPFCFRNALDCWHSAVRECPGVKHINEIQEYILNVFLRGSLEFT
jgi:hypothetical protein